MELVDMNSLGLFDIKILSVQIGFTLKDYGVVGKSIKIVNTQINML